MAIHGTFATIFQLLLIYCGKPQHLTESMPILTIKIHYQNSLTVEENCSKVIFL